MIPSEIIRWLEWRSLPWWKRAVLRITLRRDATGAPRKSGHEW